MKPREISRLRRSLGLTVEQFARAMGVSAVSIYLWGKGRVRPRPRVMVKLEGLKSGTHVVGDNGLLRKRMSETVLVEITFSSSAAELLRELARAMRRR